MRMLIGTYVVRKLHKGPFQALCITIASEKSFVQLFFFSWKVLMFFLTLHKIICCGTQWVLTTYVFVLFWKMLLLLFCGETRKLLSGYPGILIMQTLGFFCPFDITQKDVFCLVWKYVYFVLIHHILHVTKNICLFCFCVLFHPQKWSTDLPGYFIGIPYV